MLRFYFALLVGSVAALKPTGPQQQNPALLTVAAPAAPGAAVDEDAATTKLEAVVAGLSKIAAGTEKTVGQHSELKDALISPFVDQVSAILRTAKAGKLTDREKKDKLNQANA